MKLQVTDSKDMAQIPTVDSPTYIVTSAPEDQSSRKSGLTRRHVLYAVSAVAVIAIIIVAILVGMYLFTQSQKEVVKFALKFKGSDDDDIKEEVESDPNDNVVQYRVTKSGQDAYIVNDFNRGMQIVKMASSEGVNCFITALNRTSSIDPSYITGSDSMSGKNGNHDESFVISNEPVADRSFLPKKAQDLCKSVSVYWVTKQCVQQMAGNGTAGSGERNKRAIYQLGTYNGLRGLGGCCKRYYACELLMIESIQGGLHVCQTYYRTGTCCTPNAAYPVAVPYPYCLQVYSGHWLTPGLIC